MRSVKAFGAIIALAAASVIVPACSNHGASCAGASTVEVVAPSAVLTAIPARGGGGSGSSGGHSSGGSSSAGRGSGSSGASGSHSGSGSAGISGSRSGSGSAIPVSGSGSRPVTYRSPYGAPVSGSFPTHVGSTYSYGGHLYTYHPESYWTGLGAADPYNPYDQRNYSNPFSPYYHYHLAVSGC